MKRIGFSSHCFSRSLLIEEIIEFGLIHGFNAMELNVDQATFNPEIVTDTAKKLIRGISESGEVRFSMHGPEDVNFSDSTGEGREEAIRRVEAALRLAAELKIATVVVHPGKFTVDRGPEGSAEARRQTVAALKRCAETARSLDVTVSVENLCHVKGIVAPNIKIFLEMCEKVDLATIGVTLDTGHSFVDGLEHTVSVIGEYVDHIHIDDNSGQRSEHLELGRGNIDFQAIAEYFRKFEGIINIELKRTHIDNTKEEDGAPVLRSRDYLLRLLNGVPGR
ncbi:MAG TPA: sugar phosphate isomerase/epimerase [bacterium]|nr:sugar phosphate isomerase/epimerase [bacterium]